ncbi:chromosome segregation protein SMC, partial [candidate division WOR-3 bacterium]|nr:chromosome segregation protein SMC [candidate division WOR-3 bacterium]
MYIKELELIGFKSFQQKATLRFAPGMNAIVGPNGCGKSNILDALRWVLGEQSFSVLRCARNEDLVFGGTAQVPALNMAEVRLVLSTDELPELGAEVEIRRRYFRSGESEYYLNRQPCRLRDILDTFLTAGIGTKAYSIFDLRQIREIVAGNVRRMFEEAAQLAKYQEAKADCTRKLELTATDLVRLDDIIAERERVVRSLRRQAGKLRAYQRLKEEEKGFRLVELKLEHESVVRELGQAQAD